jgi:serine/threonine protein phosphatase PrpC
MKRLHTTIVGKTDPGIMRERNEDAIGWDENLHLALLADGMGGHNAGDVASAMTLDIIKQGLSSQLMNLEQPISTPQRKELILSVIHRANAEVLSTSQSNTEQKGMGSTLVVALFSENKLLVAHVGDSRLYRLRKHKLKALTNDHSLVNQLIAQGTITKDEAQNSRYNNVITRSIGHRDIVEPDIQEFRTLPNDIYLLCSDGLYEMVEEAEIKRIIRHHHNELESAVEILVNKANEYGGKDNISIVMVKTDH